MNCFGLSHVEISKSISARVLTSLQKTNRILVYTALPQRNIKEQSTTQHAWRCICTCFWWRAGIRFEHSYDQINTQLAHTKFRFVWLCDTTAPSQTLSWNSIIQPAQNSHGDEFVKTHMSICSCGATLETNDNPDHDPTLLMAIPIWGGRQTESHYESSISWPREQMHEPTTWSELFFIC